MLVGVDKPFTIVLRGYDITLVDRLFDRAQSAVASGDRWLRASMADELRSAEFRNDCGATTELQSIVRSRTSCMSSPDPPDSRALGNRDHALTELRDRLYKYRANELLGD